MIGTRMQGIRLLKLWTLAGGAFLTYWVWYVTFLPLYTHSLPSFGRYFVYSALIFLAVAIERIMRSRSLALAPAYQSADRSLMSCFRQTCIALFMVTSYSFLSKDHVISRAFLISYFLILPIVLLGLNHYVIPRLTQRIFKGTRRLSTVLIGEPEMVRKKIAWFRDRETLGLDLIGYIGNGPDGESIDGLPHLGAASTQKETLTRLRPSTAVFLDPPELCKNLIDHKLIGDKLGIRVVHIWDLQASLGVVPVIHNEGGLQFLGFHPEPLECPFNQMAKRFFDLAIALPICLFVLPPLCLLVFLSQLRQSPGKLFFIQERHGQNGRRFRMVKFRTMYENNDDEARQATKGDSRIYPIGALLRKLSLDEFPQFINVVLGDMSVVGPRPHLPQHDEEFAEVFDAYAVRTFVKPGITGLAQVRGYRGLINTPEDVRQRAESDIHYLENWSLTLDLSIILRTASGLIVPSRNAH